jgi:hypothetical protein
MSPEIEEFSHRDFFFFELFMQFNFYVQKRTVSTVVRSP